MGTPVIRYRGHASMSAQIENRADAPHKPRKFLSRFSRNQDGTTAVELAMVAVPFLGLVFGIMAAGLYFFVTFSMENAVERAARMIRTGQAQVAGMTTAQFKQEVCNRAPAFVDCDGKMRVNVAIFDSFGAVDPPGCTNDSGQLIPDPVDEAVPGQAGEIVLVTVCYEWELAGKMPFIKVGKMGNGSALIRASTTFRTEPFGSVNNN
ncbi:MAG: TadE/TadG family type IV pilus assembly protein [Pseudomonadota bacterium]